MPNIFIVEVRMWQIMADYAPLQKFSPPAQGREEDPPACETKFVFSKLKN